MLSQLPQDLLLQNMSSYHFRFPQLPEDLLLHNLSSLHFRFPQLPQDLLLQNLSSLHFRFPQLPECPGCYNFCVSWPIRMKLSEVVGLEVSYKIHWFWPRSEAVWPQRPSLIALISTIEYHNMLGKTQTSNFWMTAAASEAVKEYMV